jgi:hypothetical protein
MHERQECTRMCMTWKSVSESHRKCSKALLGQTGKTLFGNMTQSRIATRLTNNLQQGLHNMAIKHAGSSHNQTVTAFRNAAQKQSFRNALARFVTACSVLHKSVVSNKFKVLFMAVNSEAEHVLLCSISLLFSRIVWNFCTQQEEVIRYLCNHTISCSHISTDT